jgi:hypothetical protein
MQSSPEIPGFALPTVVNPTDTVCFQINVPNDPGHLKAFFGVLYDLTIWKSWQRDAAHTGILAAQVWKQIWVNLQPSDDNCECAIPIAEMDVDMSVCEQIRYNPTTNKFEGLCCGSWSIIAGQPTGGFAPAPTAQGAPLPAPNGGCQVYQGSLNANGQWLCPAPVSAGDTFQIISINGAWTDGGANWYCPTGTIFYSGLCTVGSGVNGADPLPASPHMGLISKISGAYQYIGDLAVHTVPGGVSNKLLILQANDASLSDDFGEITFQVQVCNNQVGTFIHQFDFTASNQGWQASVVGGVPATVYTPGVGWQQQYVVVTGIGYRGINISRVFTATPRVITQIVAYYTLALGAAPAGGEADVLTTSLAGVATTRVTTNYATPPASPYATPIFAGNSDTISLSFTIGKNAAGADPGGTMTLTKIVVYGNGSDPF